MPGTFDSTGGFGGGGELLGTPKGLPHQRLQDLTPDSDVGELSDRTGRRSITDSDEPDAQWAIRQLTREKPKVEMWRTEARRANSFFDGDQISEADRSVMEASGRPMITLNETQRFIRIVDGIERRVPLSVYYVARNPEDTKAQFKAECFIGETLTRAGKIRRTFERLYTGVLVDLELSNGRVLTGTPNHPILTMRGWKPLGELNEFDDLVEGKLLNDLGLGNYFDHAETRIEEKARSLETRPAATAHATRIFGVHPNDFHGDGDYGQICIVRSDRLFESRGIATFGQSIKEKSLRLISRFRVNLFVLRSFLETSHVHELAPLSASGVGERLSFGVGAHRDVVPTQCAIDARLLKAQSVRNSARIKARLIESNQFFKRCLGYLSAAFPIGGTRASQDVTRPLKPQSYGAGVEAGDFRNLRAVALFREIESGQIVRTDGPGVIPTVRVTKCARRVVHGVSVFNLETSEGFYVASGIIAHNCRTKAKEWAYDTAGAQFELARAKHDRNVTGMGWTESYISRSSNPAGIIQIQRFSPMEAIFPSSSRENLMGTKWRARKRKMPVESAIQKWPRVADILMAAAGGEGAPKDYPVKADLVRYRVPWVMTEPTNKGGDMPHSPEEISVTDFQYTKATEGYYFKDIDGQYDWLPTSTFNMYSRRLAAKTGQLPANAEKVLKDVFWRIFLLNDSLVLSGPEKMPIDGFSLNCLTGDWDEKRKLWYGMIRLFIDPQLLVDKLASSAVEIIGAQTKGGIDVEIGAMSEPQAAEYRKTASTPGAVHWFKRNALSEGRVKPKQQPIIPEGTVALLQFGMKSMETLSGLTESLLAPGDSTGVGLRQRLSMGLLLLAAYFDSSARFEREQADTTQKFLAVIADDRWVRIGGPGSEQAVQLAKDDFDDLLDTTIDDTEQDPTLRRLYMDKITELAPVLIKTNNFIPELLDWFLLPVQFREKLKQAIKQNAQQQMQMRMQGMGTGRGKSRTPEEVKAETMAVQGKAALSFAKATHLKAQSDNLSKEALSSDLRDIMDALIGAHKADLEDRKHRVDRVRAATDIFSNLRGGGEYK